LHVDDPGRRRVIGNTQSHSQLWRESAGFVASHADLVLLPLKVQVTVMSQLGLLLILKEGIMQNLIINVDLTHLRLHSLSHLLLKSLVFVVGLLSDLGDTCLFDKVRELKGRFMHTSLILEVSSLLAPMSGHGYGIPNHLHVQEKLGILSSDIPGLNHVRSTNFHL